MYYSHNTLARQPPRTVSFRPTEEVATFPLRSACLAFLFAATSLLPAPAALAETKDGTLVVAGPESFPAAYESAGKPVGYMVEILTEAFARLNRPMEIRLLPWARCLAEARAGRIDAIFPAQKTPERAGFLDYTEVPMFVEHQAFFARADAPAPSVAAPADYADLPLGLVTGVSYGSVVDPALADGTLRQVTRKGDTASLVRMLVGGRFTLIAAERQSVLGNARDQKVLGQIRELAPPIQTVQNFLAFTRERDFSTVRDAFNGAMQSMISDGTYQKILDRYSAP